MAQCAARLIQHLTQRHLDRFQLREPALPFGIGQGASRRFDFGSESTSTFCIQCGSEVRYGERQRLPFDSIRIIGQPMFGSAQTAAGAIATLGLIGTVGSSKFAGDSK